MRLFIHIPKNGGMTIRRSELRGKKFVQVSPAMFRGGAKYKRDKDAVMASTGDHHGDEHARWRDVKTDLPAFAVVRNPWSRVVSRYYFAKKAIEREKKHPAGYADVSSFEAFLEERHKWGGKEFFWHRAIRGWFPQFDYVTDEEGEVRCDILRLERLDEELNRYLGTEILFRHRNVTAMLGSDEDWRDIYTPETKRIVADWYAPDIETWGFTFDGMATKNTVYS